MILSRCIPRRSWTPVYKTFSTFHILKIKLNNKGEGTVENLLEKKNKI